jgi:hypothetical protein
MFGFEAVSPNMELIMKDIGNPRKKLQKIHEDVQKLSQYLFQYLNLNDYSYYINPHDY